MSRRTIAGLALSLSLAWAAGEARAEEVEVTAGVVTGLDCALAARAKGDLKLLNSCPPAESRKGLVVFDVAEKRVYRLTAKELPRWRLERAFGGGSIDFTGETLAVDPKTDVTTVKVAEFSITPKPKPGAFKGCL
jgi:hypothetical protein